MNNHTQPYDFQLEDVGSIDRFGGRCLLASEPGLGKTLEVLTWLAENRSSLPAVVVCPASLKWHWQRQASMHVGMESLVLEGRKIPKGMSLPPGIGLVIVNYDILGAWLKWLKGIKPRTVVCDEGHYCANKSKRTRWVKSLCEKPPYVILITGTPLLSRPAQLWNPLNIVRPDLFPHFWPFAVRHCAPVRNHWGWVYNGAENLGELHAFLKHHLMIRRRKKDVLEQLPAKVQTVVPLDLDRGARKEYDHAAADLIDWLRSKKKGNLWRAARAEALVKTGHLKHLAGRLKLPAVFDWVEDFLESGEKIILFGHHKDVLGPLFQRYKAFSVLVDGSVAKQKRQDAWDRFNQDPRTKILIGEFTAAGMGQSASDCSNDAFAELSWTPGEITQCSLRTHGIGRGKAGIQSNSHFLLARGTIEEKLCELLQWKQKNLSEVLDGESGGNGRGELDLHDMLLEKLLENDLSVER